MKKIAGIPVKPIFWRDKNGVLSLGKYSQFVFPKWPSKEVRELRLKMRLGLRSNQAAWRWPIKN